MPPTPSQKPTLDGAPRPTKNFRKFYIAAIAVVAGLIAIALGIKYRPEILQAILIYGLLFAVFLCVLFLPFWLMGWAVRCWFAPPYRLANLSWRRRRALRGVLLLWSAAFTKLTRWEKIAGIIVPSLLLFMALMMRLSVGLSQMFEEIKLERLTFGRNVWLYEGCPSPPDVVRYMGDGPEITNYVYQMPLVVSNRTYYGLFSEKTHGDTNIYVITTTGDFLILNGSQVRFHRKHY